MKPTFEVCTTDVLDPMKLPTSAHVLTVDRRSKLEQSYVLAASKVNPTSDPMHTKLERLLSKSLTTLEVMTYYLVVHTGPEECRDKVCLLVGCLTSQQQAGVSQGRICSDNFTCCHTEIEVADQTSYLTQSQYTDTGPTSPSADPITPGAWQGSHWSANFEVTGMTRPRKKSRRKRDSNPGSSALEADALTTRPTRRSGTGTLASHATPMCRP